MSDRGKRALTIFLLISGTVLAFASGLRSVYNGSKDYNASGKMVAAMEIILPDGPVSVNDADMEDLISLYGIGETLAAMIIEERELNGPFRYPEDLTAVRGIGVKKVNGFRNSINLQ